MFLEESEHVVVFDYSRKFSSACFNQLLDIGVKTVISTISWFESEQQPDIYDFKPIIDYTALARSCGMKVLIKTYQGCPFWSPLSWFMRNDFGEYNIYYHEHPMLGRNDFDPQNFAHVQIHYLKQIPSYWCSEALAKLDNWLVALGKTIQNENSFITNTIGIGGEYYMNGRYFYTENALESYQNFLHKKYKTIEVYNTLHKTKFYEFSEILYDILHANTELYDWHFETIKNRTQQECELLKPYNPSNEQFASLFYERKDYENQFDTFAAGTFDPFYMWKTIQANLNLEQISIFKMVMFLENYPLSTQFENLLECRKHQLSLWTGAEGPYNIVNNTKKAILNGQRGFICGLPETINFADIKLNQINVEQVENIKKSLNLWKQYYPIYKELNQHDKY